MTKLKDLSNEPSKPPKDYLDNIQQSPYWAIALKICHEKWGIDDPNILHILCAMSEIAKIDNKINQGK